VGSEFHRVSPNTIPGLFVLSFPAMKAALLPVEAAAKRASPHSGGSPLFVIFMGTAAL
jgi:hypothetical protein